MATIIEQLLSTMTDAEKATIRAKLAENPQILVDDQEAGNLLSVFKVAPAETTTVTPPSTTTPHVPALPSAAAAAAPAVVPNTSASTAATATDSAAAILSKLNELKTSLDTRVSEMEKKFVPVADLDKHRTQLLTDAIKASDDYASVREAHREEFGKPLDRAVFEKFVADSGVNGKPRYASMKDAHDAFVSEDRINLRVKKEVDDAVKQRTSSTTVPGQSQSTGRSAAQQVMDKARAAKAGDGNSNLTSAISALDKIERNRTDTTVQ